MREDFIHFFARKFLRSNGWELIAGQYPNGSDDELTSLNIMDPVLAKDESPDPRRHSKNKLVPDIVACRGKNVLIVEAKPRYDIEDKGKLSEIVGVRKKDFMYSLAQKIEERNINLTYRLSDLILVPCLCFSSPSIRFPISQGFAYLIVKEDIQRLVGNGFFPDE